MPHPLKINTPYGEKEIEIQYEWVPHFCSQCNRIGHSDLKCKKKKVVTAKPKQVLRPKSVQDAHAATVIPATAHQEVPADSIQSNVPIAADNKDDGVTAAHKDDGFTTVVRRSISPKRREPAHIASEPAHFADGVTDVHNSFAALLDDSAALLEENSSENLVEHTCMVEGGATPHTDKLFLLGI